MDDSSTDESLIGRREVPERYNNKPDKLPQFYSAISACLGSFAMGTVLAYTSPVLPQLQASTSTIPVSKTEGDWIGSLMALGALAGAPFGGYLMNKLGRRGLLIMLSFPFAVAWLLITYAQNVSMIYAGRFLSGMATGCVSLAIPVYISEIAHVSIRGMLLTGIQIMVSSGIVFVYVFGSLLTWQWLSFVCGCIPVMMAALLLLAPESPTHLMANARPIEAKAALLQLRGDKYDPEDELEDIINNLQVSATSAGFSMRDLKLPVVWKPLIASIGLMLLQQFSGINNIIFYTQTIFRYAGSTLSASLSSIIVGITQLSITVISSFLVDKWGRKLLLLISSAVMMISLTALGAYFYLKTTQGDEIGSSISWFPLVTVMVFVMAFSFGLGAIPWMMMGELFASQYKEVACSIATCVNWGSAFVVTNTFTKIQVVLELYGTFWLYAGFCGLGVVFVLLLVPETKGKTLQEITREFAGTSYTPVAIQEQE